MNERTLAFAALWNSLSAIAGKMVLSIPTMAPTKAFTTTRRENGAQFARSPNAGGGGGAKDELTALTRSSAS